MRDELKPCPFCGGVATIVNIDSLDEHDPNAGGSYVACQFCLAASRVIFGEKDGLVEAWNSRADDARIRAEARAEALREAAERAVNAAYGFGSTAEQDARYALKLRAAILADEPKEEINER